MKKTLLVVGFIGLALASCGGNSDSAKETTQSTSAEPSTTVSAQTTGPVLPGEKLVAKNDCIGCHNKTQKVIGPAYVDIADKYASNDENIDILSESVINGSKGKWGDLPMTPHPNVSKSDAKQMVTWILSLKK